MPSGSVEKNQTAGSAAATTATTTTTKPAATAVADERYAKFIKMQQMLPEDAVRQKMNMEGNCHDIYSIKFENTILFYICSIK